MALTFRKLSTSSRAAFLYMTVLCLLFSLHLFTGMADNGDFSRVYGFLIHKPMGWAVDIPAANSPDWTRRFFQIWIDRWDLYPGLSNIRHRFSFSTERFYLALQIAFSAVVTWTPGVYSVIVGSLLGRAVYLGGFLWLFFLLRCRESNRAAWSYLIIGTPIILSTSFVAFLNSFYEEQIGIILFPVIAALLYLIATTRDIRCGRIAFAIICFVALSKVAYFMLPMIAAPFLYPAFRGKVAARKFWIAVLVATAVSFLPSRFGQTKIVNQFHALYYGALTILKDDGEADIKSIGSKPVYPECISSDGFDAAGAQCIARAHATYLDTLRLIATYPTIAPRMIGRALATGRHLTLDNIGLNLADGPSFSTLPLFTLWQRIYAHYGNIVALLLGGLALLGWKHLGPLARVAVFFAGWGAVQYVMALGDGFFELRKHLIGANYALTLSLALIASSLLTSKRRAMSQSDGGDDGQVQQTVQIQSAA